MTESTGAPACSAPYIPPPSLIERSALRQRGRKRAHHRVARVRITVAERRALTDALRGHLDRQPSRAHSSGMRPPDRGRRAACVRPRPMDDRLGTAVVIALGLVIPIAIVVSVLLFLWLRGNGPGFPLHLGPLAEPDQDQESSEPGGGAVSIRRMNVVCVPRMIGRRSCFAGTLLVSSWQFCL